MRSCDLKYVTGKTLKEGWRWLDREQEGCCTTCFAETENYRYYVCMGWHDLGDGPEEADYHNWAIAWKIGRQTHDNIMQCDFDVDFEMPQPCNEYGDVWDSVQTIKPPAKQTKKFWNDLAIEIRKEARKVWQFFKDKDDWEQEDFAFQRKMGGKLKVLADKGTIRDHRLRKLGRGRYEWNGSEGKYTIMHLGRSWEISVNQHIYTTAPQSLKEAVKILDERERYK